MLGQTISHDRVLKSHWIGVEPEFTRAIELNPNFAYVHENLMEWSLIPLGRIEEGISELRPAYTAVFATLGDHDAVARKGLRRALLVHDRAWWRFICRQSSFGSEIPKPRETCGTAK